MSGAPAPRAGQATPTSPDTQRRAREAAAQSMWCCGISRETWLVVAVLLAAFVAAVSVAMSILVNELEGSGGSPILFLGVILPLILVAVALGLLGAGWVAERRWYAVVLYPRGFAACMSHHCSPWLPRGSFSVGVDIMFSSAFVLWNVGGQVRALAGGSRLVDRDVSAGSAVRRAA